jgi:hypothetical protein
VWTSVDYELDWPPELLAGELHALFDHPYRDWTGGEVELLLTEAFHTGIPAAEFTRLLSNAEWTTSRTSTPRPAAVWWYLSTIELTDRLLARQGAEHAP